MNVRSATSAGQVRRSRTTPSARILVEDATGLEKPRAVRLGEGHAFIDCSDEPAPTVLADRPVSFVVQPGRGSRRSPVEKPPYAVPSMAEIAAIKPNGLTVASTFSGAGGSSLGYRIEGFRVVYANEFVEAAREVYRANASAGTVLDGRDIREVTADDVLKRTGLKVGDLDILDGSPPCAAFSSAGKRSEGWGLERAYSDRTQRTDDLFFEFARLLSGLQPRTFVAENVSGLVKGPGKGYFLDILAALKDAGYRVEARLLDAQWLGVPQRRKRIIFVGVRNDLRRAPAFPTPLPYRYAIRDAIPWLDGSGPAPETEADIGRFAVGREWDNLGPGEWSTRYFQLVRPAVHEPSPTITADGGSASLAGVTHPTERRKFSIAELKRLCGFPDDFVLSGTYAQRWERLGRAVPPPMMARIAATLRDEVLR
jgi:DNA (cytosine-5)-methyltransferase 1